MELSLRSIRNKSTIVPLSDIGPIPDCQEIEISPDGATTPQVYGVVDYISGRGSVAKVIW